MGSAVSDSTADTLALARVAWQGVQGTIMKQAQ